MRGIVILGGLILLFGTACHSAKVTEASDWPRISFEARLLSVPQEFVEEFSLVREVDDDGRLLQFPADGRLDESRTLDQSELELLLHATQAHQYAMSITAPRVVVPDGRLVGVTFVFPRGFEFVASDGYADSDFESRWRKVELGLASDPLHAETTGCANVRVDVRFVGHLDSEDRTYKPVVLDLWPPATKNYSAPAGQAWLISLPSTKIREALSDPDDDARHYLLLIRPVLLHSQEHEERLFPGLGERAHGLEVFSPG